ncbi:MAG: hypothetical protein P8141_13215 [Gammaproteobacteria bacterium]
MISFNATCRRTIAPLSLIMMLGQYGPAANAAVGDPAGGEVQVNTSTLFDQENPAVVINPAGDFEVLWEGINLDSGDYGIYAQRYNADGTSSGRETRINTTLLNDQSSPKTAVNADGNFIVVWENADDNGDFNVYARRFNADGSASGGDFRVNSVVISSITSETVPAVAMDSTGNFTVAWESYDDVNGDDDIYARRFDASGTPLGPEIRVNTEIANDQMLPATAMSAAGDFIVAWQSAAQDSDGSTGIYAQRYDAIGTPLGGEFRVNTTTANAQTAATVAMSAAGDFIVAWQSAAQDSDGSTGIYAQRYDAIGTPLGGEFRVNSEINNDQTTPVAAMNPGGDLLMAWESMAQDGDGKGVYGQRYDTTGTAVGAEFRVNTTTAQTQMLPAAAINADLDMVVAWQSYGQDNVRHPSYGIYAQRYLGNNLVASSSNVSSSGGGGGGVLGWLSMMLVLPAWYRRRRATPL